MIEVDQHDGAYLSICKHYRAMYNTDVVQESEGDRRLMMQHAILYLLLSPFDNEQSDLTHRFLQEKVVDEIPKYKYEEIFFIPYSTFSFIIFYF